jgi:hypothetical protein
MNHRTCSQTSRALCDALIELLRQNIPQFRCSESENWCAPYADGHPRFAFVQHYSKSAIKVYCLGDAAEIQEVALSAGLQVMLRRNVRANDAWGARFCCQLVINSIGDVDSAVRVLMETSYRISLLTTANARSAKPSNTALIAEEILPSAEYCEGSVTTILVNRFERNRNARAQCIKMHGLTCWVCGFNFEATYGKPGKGLIHVHHIRPLATIKRGYKVDARNDLCPICPNCHALIHRKDPPYSLDEARALLT